MTNPQTPILIVTSAVAPAAGIPFLTLVDPRERLLQTYCGLLSWIRQTPIAAIVLCDNTGIDHRFAGLAALAEAHGKRLEILAFRGDDEELRLRGKGYGEGEILQHVLDHSRLLAAATSFYKVTGRVFVEDFADLHHRFRKQPVVFGLPGNLAPWRRTLLRTASRCGLLEACFRRLRNNYVATTFYKCSVDYYRAFLAGRFRLVDDRQGYFLERALLPPLFDHGFDVFPRPLSLVGISGSKGCLYGHRDYAPEVKELAARLLARGE